MEAPISRRADYTFKHNASLGRHGWLRLTPAYSVRLVEEILFKASDKQLKVLDPFSGTATTGLAAAQQGFDATLFDINPFLVWFGNTKCGKYDAAELLKLESQLAVIVDSTRLREDAWKPAIFNIERWWQHDTLNFLASLRAELSSAYGEPSEGALSNLVWVAFCRLIIETSSADFNHVSMSFKETQEHFHEEDLKYLYLQIFSHIRKSASSQINGQALIINGDSRNLSESEKRFDLVITSPPYPNRMSYIRELRPYMYWTKFLLGGNDAGLLDWEAIGGTWGVATSKLKDWKPINENLPNPLAEVCEKIECSGDKNSKLMSLYVHKYFDDLHEHVKNIKSVLNKDATLNYIVGNSSFYNIFVDTEKILALSFEQLGFTEVKIEAIRKRNTKRGLIEFNVSAKN